MSKIKKKVALAAFLLAASPTIAPPAFAARGHDILCQGEATTFNQWFYQVFYC